MIYFNCRTKHPVVRLLSRSPEDTLSNILPPGYKDAVYLKMILGRVTDITGIPKPGELKLMLGRSTVPSKFLRSFKLKAFIAVAKGETQEKINYLRIFFSYNYKDLDNLTIDNWSQGIKFTVLDPFFDFKCYLYSMEK